MVQTFGVEVIAPLIGSTRPPRRLNRAIPDEMPVLNNQTAGHESAGTSTEPLEPMAASDVTSSPSVVQELVNSLSGRVPGLREPSVQEIDEVSAMFPHLSRQSVMVALQRRYAFF